MKKNIALFFGPDLAMASWKILFTILIFALLSFWPSFSSGTLFCGDFGYPFAYAEGYGPCQYDKLCQDFYPVKMVYVILISYLVSCIILTYSKYIPVIIQKIKIDIKKRNKERSKER